MANQPALAGMTVVEFGQALAVPMCGLLLSDMGANVIKVEPPTGESFRHGQAEIIPGESKGFIALNRGKRSVCLDLTNNDSRPIIDRLVAIADVILVGMKPADIPRYGLDYERVAAMNPRVVYLDHAPFGQRGPYGGEGGYDVIMQGMSGLATITGRSPGGEVPENVRPAYIDMGTGFLSAFGVATALLSREQTGKGQRVETSLLSTAYGLGAVLLNWFAATDPPVWDSFHEQLAALRLQGANYERQRELYQETILAGSRGNIYFRHYRTSDGMISVGCLSPGLNKRFRDATGIDDPRATPGFDMGSETGRAAIAAMVESAETTMRTRTTAEWLAHFREQGVPAGPFNFPTEAMFDEQAEANDFVVDFEHPVLGPYRTFGNLVRMDGTPTVIQGPSPSLGVHTREVLGGLGYDAVTIDDFMQRGVAGPGELG